MYNELCNEFCGKIVLIYRILTGPKPIKGGHIPFGLQQVGGQRPSPHMFGFSLCPHIGTPFASISVHRKHQI